MVGRAGSVVLVLVLACAFLQAVPANAASAEDWAQFGGSARHLGTNPEEDAFTPANVSGLAVAWSGSYGTNATDESSPVIAGGMAYIAGFDGAISAFDASGCGAPTCEPLWRGQTGNDITGSPAVADGTVLIGSADHHLYAFRAAGCGAPTCQPLWRGNLGGAVVDSSVAVADGTAFVGTYDDGRLYAFSVAGCAAATCAPLWVGVGGGHLVSSPAVARGSVYIGSDDGHLYVFPAAGCGAKSCGPSWAAPIGGPAYSTSPTVAGDVVFMGSAENFAGFNGPHLRAFPAAGCGAPTCRPLWTADVGDGGIGSTPAVAGGWVFVSSQATPDPNTVGVVSAFRVKGCGSALCEPRWTGVNFASGFMSSPAVVGGVVFVAKGPALGVPVDAGLYAFDARGCGSIVCAPLAFVEVGPDQFYLGSSVAIAGGRIMFGSNDNDAGSSNLYVLSLPV